MTEKLYTEDQVQALIAAAYEDAADTLLEMTDSPVACRLVLQASSGETAKTKLREMLMEVAIMAHADGLADIWADRVDSSTKDIVNEVLGETS